MAGPASEGVVVAFSILRFDEYYFLLKYSKMMSSLYLKLKWCNYLLYCYETNGMLGVWAIQTKTGCLE